MFATLLNPVIVFDIEYTDPAEYVGTNELPEIVEIAGHHLTPDLIVYDKFSRLVRPKDLSKWTDHSVKLTGITVDQLEQADPWEDVWEDWAKFTRFKGLQLMSWDAYNDMPILRREYDKRMLGFPHKAFILDAASIFYTTTCYLGILPAGWSLKAVCNRLHIADPPHRAAADAYCVVQILESLQEYSEAFSDGREQSDEHGREYPT